jgi:uncharacterized phage-associated protein
MQEISVQSTLFMEGEMAYSAMAVANAFVSRAKAGELRNLTPMKLQKLLFFAQSWHLARNDEPLVDEFFCRWQYGPVIPSLYHEFKEYGAAAISTYGGHIVERNGEMVKVRPIVSDSDVATWELIDEIISIYGAYSGSQLSAITHEKGSAWAETGTPDGDPISNADLAHYIANNSHYHAHAA